MSLQTSTEFVRARLLSDRPLTFELAFDRSGHGNFKAAHTICIQLAARHMVGNICELRDGVAAPWDISLSEGSILLKIETYGILSEWVELKARPDRAAIEVSYRLEFLKTVRSS